MNENGDPAGRQAVSRLRRMLRYDTTNPPGNEAALAEDLAGELREAGLEAEVLESAPGRGNLVARIRGDGSERPLLFLSHLDVVPAEPEQWSHPPFEGVEADGFVWGRGAIDSKLTGAVQAQVALMAKSAALPLKRDLVLVAAADEEMGGVHGVRWLADSHPEAFDAEYGINEAGGFALTIGGKRIYTCQTAEKGSAAVDLVAHGRPGHSSVPHDENAVVGLGRALTELGGRKMPHAPPPSVRAFFDCAAAAQDDGTSAALLRQALEPEAHADALTKLGVNEPTRLMLDAMLRNTCAPTMLSAGMKRNVIPSEARASLSGRPLPGVDEATFLGELRKMVGDGVSLEMTEPFRSGVAFPHDSPLFEAVDASLRRFEPGGVVAPYMQTGGTDARFLADRDITVYGFIPMRYEEGLDFFDLCHGHDERVSVANVSFAVQVLYDLVLRMNGLSA